MTYSEPSSGLFWVRFRSACTTLKDRNGNPIVIVLGGAGSDSKGMELWDVEAEALKSFESIPLDEQSSSQGLQDAQVFILPIHYYENCSNKAWPVYIIKNILLHLLNGLAFLSCTTIGKTDLRWFLLMEQANFCFTEELWADSITQMKFGGTTPLSVNNFLKLFLQ